MSLKTVRGPWEAVVRMAKTPNVVRHTTRDRISTEASFQAPSIATLMDGPEAPSIREMGG